MAAMGEKTRATIKANLSIILHNPFKIIPDLSEANKVF